MRKLKISALAFAMGITASLQTGCYGEFALTHKVYDWNGTVSPNKFVKSLVFFGLCIIPVYGVVVFIDAVILNLIEFWTGTNPVSMNEGDYEMQLVTVKGDRFKMEATKDTFTTTQLTGKKAGEVRIMKFDRATLTWKYTDSKICDQPVMTFLDAEGDQVRLYTTTGTVDLAMSDLTNEELLLAKFGAQRNEAMACSD
ncbi:MAG: DUF3332 family protein [Flavobacteriales bacterium]|nr:DUF3332 family protein [Flavobacteriales bacterium]